MKKLLIWVSAAILFMVANASFAADFKVGVINMQKILQNDPQVQVLEDKLKKQFSPQQDKLVALQKQINDDITKYKRDASVMKDSDKKATEQKINDEGKKLQDSQADFQKQFVLAREDALQTVLKDIEGIVGGIAKANGFNLVIAKANVAYNDPSLDITDQVISKIQAEKAKK